MQFRTHIAFAFLISLFLIDYFKIKNQIIFLTVILFFSVIPDIDEYSSKISKKLRPFSYIINLLFTHRGFFHSIYIPLLSLMLFPVNKPICLAALIGYLSHLFLDALTIGGISPLSPLFNGKIRGFIKVNSLLENIFFYALVTFIVYKLVYV